MKRRKGISHLKDANVRSIRKNQVMEDLVINQRTFNRHAAVAPPGCDRPPKRYYVIIAFSVQGWFFQRHALSPTSSFLSYIPYKNEIL